MRKNFGSKSGIFPMPVLMIGTYDKDGNPNVMNAAWGMMQDFNRVVLNLTETHKTVNNIKESGAFTIGIATVDTMAKADYVGITSGNNDPDKFKKSGLTEIKSEFVNAPIITDFPVTMECKFIEFQNDDTGCGVIGEIVNLSVDEKVLDDEGNIDPSKINALVYDTFKNGYYTIGEKVGNAFKEGAILK